MNFAIIGDGAIASYVRDALAPGPHVHTATLLRPDRADEAAGRYGAVGDLPAGIDVVIDCAGHAALRTHGPDILARGMDLVSVSVGALADADLSHALEAAAQKGRARLHLASGAIGALDCLQAARAGSLAQVSYVGRKPPTGWKGSVAEQTVDLDGLHSGSVIHFEGTAREAALRYPKNANVAAAVALAGTGFDATRVTLIADADVSENIHEVTAQGDFGQFTFRICGKALPGNPRSSALAAMSVAAKIEQLSRAITL